MLQILHFGFLINAYQFKIHIKNIFTPEAKQKQKPKQN